MSLPAEQVPPCNNAVELTVSNINDRYENFLKYEKGEIAKPLISPLNPEYFYTAKYATHPTISSVSNEKYEYYFFTKYNLFKNNEYLGIIGVVQYEINREIGGATFKIVIKYANSENKQAELTIKTDESSPAYYACPPRTCVGAVCAAFGFNRPPPPTASSKKGGKKPKKTRRNRRHKKKSRKSKK